MERPIAKPKQKGCLGSQAADRLANVVDLLDATPCEEKTLLDAIRETRRVTKLLHKALESETTFSEIKLIEEAGT